MAKKILYQDNARRALERGMEIMVEAVSVTLGPKGRNVVLEKQFGSPQIVNDGVTIAKEITLEDHIENTGVSLIRQAASKTNDVAGDGTTTATVLAYAMVKEGLKNVAAGSNPISIKLGMEKATQYLVSQINEFAQPVEDIQAIQQVASISAGNDNVIGSLIADALAKVGKEGVISLEEGKGIVTELEITEGMKLQPCSPGFVDGRDAIFAADLAIYGGANECLLWDAFAKRGLGFSADQGSTSSRSDGTAAFDLPPNFGGFDTIDTICETQGIQTGLSGGSPAGGTYSGTGVTDNGDGTFDFDPTVGGPGDTIVTYAVLSPCSGLLENITDCYSFSYSFSK